MIAVRIDEITKQRIDEILQECRTCKKFKACDSKYNSRKEVVKAAIQHFRGVERCYEFEPKEEGE